MSFQLPASTIIVDQNCASVVEPQIEDIKNLTDQLNLKINFKQTEPFIVFDSEKSISIKQIRQINHKSNFASYSQQMPQIILIWQAEKMTLPASNALLKILEEPPANFFIILITANPSGLLETVKSRCQILFTGHHDLPVSSENDLDLDKLIQGKLNFSDCIDLTSKHSDKIAAQVLLTNLIKLIKQTKSFPQKDQLNQISQILRANEQILANINVKLVLEQLFFSFIKQ